MDYKPYWFYQPNGVAVAAGATGTQSNPQFYRAPVDMIVDWIALCATAIDLNNVTVRFGIMGKPWFSDYVFSAPAIHNIVRQISISRGGMHLVTPYKMPHGESFTLRFFNSAGGAINMDVVFEAYRTSDRRPYFLSQQVNPGAVAGWSSWGGLSLQNQAGETIDVESIWFSLRFGSAALVQRLDQLIVEPSSVQGAWSPASTQGIPLVGYMKDFGVDVGAAVSEVAFYKPKHEFILPKDDSIIFEFNNNLGVGAPLIVHPIVHGRVKFQ